MYRMNITLPQEIVNALRTNVPPRSRSKFIASAVKEKLGKKADIKTEWEKSLKANREYDKQIMEEWSAAEFEG